MSYKTEQKGNVTIVHIPYGKTLDQRFLLSADRHWDNAKSDQGLQKKHLDEAVDRRAGIIDFGDLFCAMQGKYDKRKNKDSLRPEHKVDDYLDALVNTASVFFGPYAKRFIRIAYGNHETAILGRHETDLTSRLIEKLNQQGGKVHHGGISGWVHFQFHGEQGTIHKKLWYHHGYGGGGPVTRGVIQTNRRAVYVPDADFVISGHVHEEWNVTICRSRLDDQSQQRIDEQQHIQIPTYKEEYGDGFAGWHVEGGKPPKPIGAVWLSFRKERNSSSIEHEFKRAK